MEASATQDAGGTSHRTIAIAIERFSSLATLPKVALEVNRLVEDTYATAEDLDGVIRRDAPLTARILKVANSSFYGSASCIDSIEQAVVLLGCDAVRNIALAGSCHRLFQAGFRGAGLDLHDLWRQSVAVATAARLIAGRTKLVGTSGAYLAGILHELGVLIELQVYPARFLELAKTLKQNEPASLLEAEHHAFHATHPEFAMVLCRKWSFPAALACSVGYHHHPLRCPAEHRALAATVHVAESLAYRAGLRFLPTTDNNTPEEGALGLLGLDDDALAQLSDALAQTVADELRLFPN